MPLIFYCLLHCMIVYHETIFQVVFSIQTYRAWEYLDSLNHSVNIDGLHRPLPNVGDNFVVVIPAFDELGTLLGCNLEYGFA